MGKRPKTTVDGEKKPVRKINPSRDMPVTFETVKDPAILQEILDYAKEGCTFEQIANRLLVTRQTLYNWTKKYPELRDVINEGNRVADDRVEMSLYDMCFPHDEREVEVEKDASGQVIKQKIRTRHYEPNITAIQYWLQNRRRDVWKNHQSLEFSGNSSVAINIIYDLNTKDKPTIEGKSDV